MKTPAASTTVGSFATQTWPRPGWMCRPATIIEPAAFLLPTDIPKSESGTTKTCSRNTTMATSLPTPPRMTWPGFRNGPPARCNNSTAPFLRGRAPRVLGRLITEMPHDRFNLLQRKPPGMAVRIAHVNGGRQSLTRKRFAAAQGMPREADAPEAVIDIAQE